MKITVHTLDNSEILNEYFKIREKEFQDKWGFEGYNDWPTKHDKIEGTTFLVFSEKNSKGEDIVFGGRRIVLAERYKDGKPNIGILPFETKYSIKNDKLFEKYPSILNKEYFDILNVLPGVLKKPISYCEIGGFAIDIKLTKELFPNKNLYVQAREEIYKTTLDVAKDLRQDFAIIVAQEFNLKKQTEYLAKEKIYKSRVLKPNDKMYAAVMKGDAPLVVNLSERYPLNEMLRQNTENLYRIR
jgi:hypothetical protein